MCKVSQVSQVPQIFLWTLAARHQYGVVKDIRRLIGNIVWRDRMAWAKKVPFRGHINRIQNRTRNGLGLLQALNNLQNHISIQDGRHLLFPAQGGQLTKAVPAQEKQGRFCQGPLKGVCDARVKTGTSASQDTNVGPGTGGH